MILCKTIFKYKTTVVGSLLLCKLQLVPLVLELSFRRIDANRILSMIMQLYKRKVTKMQ
jgi:hypothetical protein